MSNSKLKQKSKTRFNELMSEHVESLKNRIQQRTGKRPTDVDVARMIGKKSREAIQSATGKTRGFGLESLDKFIEVAEIRDPEKTALVAAWLEQHLTEGHRYAKAIAVLFRTLLIELPPEKQTRLLTQMAQAQLMDG